jgi:hypothetical protein
MESSPGRRHGNALRPTRLLASGLLGTVGSSCHWRRWCSACGLITTSSPNNSRSPGRRQWSTGRRSTGRVSRGRGAVSGRCRHEPARSSNVVVQRRWQTTVTSWQAGGWQSLRSPGEVIGTESRLLVEQRVEATERLTGATAPAARRIVTPSGGSGESFREISFQERDARITAYRPRLRSVRRTCVLDWVRCCRGWPANSGGACGVVVVRASHWSGLEGGRQRSRLGDRWLRPGSVRASRP